MGAAVAMVTALPGEAARTPPGSASSHHPGLSPVQLRDGVYRALQHALDVYPGGIQQFAEDIGAARSDTYTRVGRKEDSKGCLQRAFLDYLGQVFSDRPSALCFVAEVNKLLDLEPPVSRRRVSEEEIGAAWLRSLDSLPPGEREGRRRDMAAALGIRPEDLR
jgi:hypothetical protein